MRKALMLAIFLSPMSFAAQPLNSVQKEKEPTGFMEIKFGASKDDALKFFIEKYHLTKDEYGVGYTGDGSFQLNAYDDFLTAPSFCIAGTCYDLYLFFGSTNKFYSYEISAKPRNANYFDTGLKEDAETLSKMFTAKFGPPSAFFDPKFFEVKEGYATFFRKWKSHSHEIFTGLEVHDSEYRAKAVVTDILLSGQEESAQKDKKDRDLKKASQGF